MLPNPTSVITIAKFCLEKLSEEEIYELLNQLNDRIYHKIKTYFSERCECEEGLPFIPK